MPWNEQDLIAFVRGHKLAVVATVSETGAPEAAVVGIAISDAGELVFDTLELTRKCQNLRKNARVAVVVGWDDQTLQLEGVADEPAGDDLARLREVYFTVYPDGRDRLRWPGITHVRVRPRWARHSDYRNGETITELILDE